HEVADIVVRLESLLLDAELIANFAKDDVLEAAAVESAPCSEAVVLQQHHVFTMVVHNSHKSPGFNSLQQVSQLRGRRGTFPDRLPAGICQPAVRTPWPSSQDPAPRLTDLRAQGIERRQLIQTLCSF